MTVHAAQPFPTLEKIHNTLAGKGNPAIFGSGLVFGTKVAAVRHMDTKMNWLYPVGAALLAIALPAAGAADAVFDVIAWIGDSHIAEVVVAANALTIVP